MSSVSTRGPPPYQSSNPPQTETTNSPPSETNDPALFHYFNSLSNSNDPNNTNRPLPEELGEILVNITLSISEDDPSGPSADYRTLYLFCTRFKPRLPEIPDQFVGKALTYSASDLKTLDMFLDHFKNLQGISTEDLGEALTQTQSVVRFFESFTGNTRLQGISNEHLGFALTKAASNPLNLNSITKRFFERLKNLPPDILGNALVEASSNPEALKLYLKTVNDSLQQISSNHLGQALVEASSNPKTLKLLYDHCDYIKNPNLKSISNDMLIQALSAAHGNRKTIYLLKAFFSKNAMRTKSPKLEERLQVLRCPFS